MMIDDDRRNNDMRSTPESPGGGRSVLTTGEGPILPGSDGTTNEEAHLNPNGRSVSDGFRKTGSRGQRRINIATWHVRTLYECGKLAQVKAEAERLSIDIVADDGFVSRAVGGSISAFCVYVRRQRQRTATTVNTRFIL